MIKNSEQEGFAKLSSSVHILKSSAKASTFSQAIRFWRTWWLACTQQEFHNVCRWLIIACKLTASSISLYIESQHHRMVWVGRDH